MDCFMATKTSRDGYDPIELAAATEKVVVAGNRRKYVQLGRPLRFYGGPQVLRKSAATYVASFASATSRYGSQSRQAGSIRPVKYLKA